MLVLGIDPGLATMGYGIVRKAKPRVEYVAGGTIATSSRRPYAERLNKLYTGVCTIIEQHRPQVLVMERPIYCQNIKTALTLGQAGGMAVLAAARHDVQLVEYAPSEVKLAVVGKGRATKEQVLRMVSTIIKLPEPLTSEHVADALACAICFAHSHRSSD